MKRTILLLYVVCFTIGLSANDSDSIRLSLYDETIEDYIFCLHNNTNDSIYLFDGYFEKCYDGYIYTSMYVHRYDKTAKTYKLSLLPLLPVIRFNGCLNGLWGRGRDKLVNVAQMTFSFTAIAPHDSLMVNIKKEAFQSLLYVNDIHPEKLSCFHHILPKMNKKTLKKVPEEIIFELGVYKEVDYLLTWCHDVDMGKVDKLATAMIVVSIPVNDNMMPTSKAKMEHNTPITTYKKALQVIERSKEYMEFIKQRVGKRGKYIVMTKIFDFQEEALMFRDLPDDLDSVPLVYADYYEDIELRKLSHSKKGIIIISFSKIFKNYFTITVYVARHELSNPQIEDLWFTGLHKIFLLKQTDHGVQIIKTTEAYAD